MNISLKKKTQQFFKTPISGSKIYFVAFLIYFLLSFIATTTFTQYVPSKIINMTGYLSVGLIIIKIYLFDNYKLNHLLLITIGLALAVISWEKTQSNLILMMMTFILGAKDVKFDDIINWYYYIGLAIMIVTIISALLGVIPDLTYTSKLRPSRYALGILYPTDFAAHVVYLLLAYSYLNFKKLNWKYYGVYIVIALILKYLTDARLDVYSIILMIPVLIISTHANKKNNWAKIISSFYWAIVPIISFSALMATVFYDQNNHLLSKLDHLLSGRLTFGNLAFDRYGISTWGQKVVEKGMGTSNGMHQFKHNLYEYLFIDSSYVRLFIIYGFVIALVILSVMMYISIKSIRNGNYVIPALMLILAVSCLIEQHLLELAFNPFLLAFLANIKNETISEEKIHE